MAKDDPSWGYTRIVGALADLGHEVARTTVAKILKARCWRRLDDWSGVIATPGTSDADGGCERAREHDPTGVEARHEHTALHVELQTCERG